MDLTVPNVYGLLIRSKLLSLEEARAMYARWQEEAGSEVQNLGRFAAWMVAQKYLTEYQAGLLARGHAEGFFLNEYKILDRLGKGRMAGVYRAQHQLGQIVAVKVLPPSKARDPQYFARFQRESRLALRFKHVNIVRTFEVGEAGGLHYLVMEYLEGETLEEVLLRRKRLRPEEAVHLVYQALQGLQHIHECGVIHRDLKPANMMLVPSSGAPQDLLRATVKILDIGLGRALFDDPNAEMAFDQGLTAEGVMLGTPDYMAPEQARDARVIDIRADIYSLGCVLYHLLTGQPPFPDTNIISQMIRHATEAPAPLVHLNPDVPEGLQQIVNWMMAKEPSGRYPTPERAAQALQIYLVARPGQATAGEGDAGMQTFLTWLEQHRPSQPEPSRIPEDSKPATSSTSIPTQPMILLTDPPAGRSAEDAGRKKGRVPARVRVPPPLPTADAPTQFPPAVPSPATPMAMPPGRFTRRELVIFAIGVVCGAIATFLGCLFALRGRS